MEREIRRWERRWLWLHGTRQAGRSLLTALLSAALLLGCGYLRQSIRENLDHIDRLYQTVQVTASCCSRTQGISTAAASSRRSWDGSWKSGGFSPR